VIREFGILNTNIPEEHDWYGIPFPGTYMVDENGKVFDKTFFADHAVRESVNDMLQESFRITDAERGEMQTVESAHLSAKAYFASPTVRGAQRIVLTVEIELKKGMHVYGQPLPDGYIPIELSLVDAETLKLLEVEYPEPQEIRFDAIDETLPAYKGRLEIKAHCRGTANAQETRRVQARLRYQACDDKECYLPQTISFDLPIQVLPHDWEKLD
jgi:DsbC/DsbD-like thiol-disulfide interchange protein